MNQSKALALLKSGRNVFLTGSAGAGKTYVLNQYITYLKQHKVPVAVTASTGIASTHINGQTIHSWAGIGIKNQVDYRRLNLLKQRKYFRDKMDSVKVLVIDEISMLHRNQLDLVNLVLKYFKNNDLAFGGVQIILSGDFFQLPPIGEPEETNRDKFAFMSDAWLEANLAICYLTEQHRQSDNIYNEILNEIRTGNVSEKSLKILENRIEYFRDMDSEETRLYSHNFQVDKVNMGRLYQLDTDPKTYRAIVKGNEALVEMLKKSVLAEETLELKIGARVMFVKNNWEIGYINGTIGTVTGYSEKGHPLVRTLNHEIFEAAPEDWSITDENEKVLASYTQIPLRLAWAITVHKSQGMTLDSAIIDLGMAFEKGQGYVALSRLKTLDGLKLYGLNETALEVDSLALKADARFQVLSHELDERTDEETLSKNYHNFIRYCGGTLDPKEINKQKEKLKVQKEGKKNTVDLTLEWVKKGLTIDEIAKERGLVSSSIIEHLSKIKDQYPDVDLNPYKPDEKLIKKIEACVKELQIEENRVLKPIYDYFNGELGYPEIKLAMVFIEPNLN